MDRSGRDRPEDEFGVAGRMKMADEYDVVIIGSGPAGRAAGRVLVENGMSVAMVEDYGFGGTCPLRGCEPKKLLVDASDTVARASDMKAQGLTGELKIDWPALMKFNRSFVEPVSDRVESWLGYQGIETFFGQARFEGPSTVRVGEDVLAGKHVVVATGAVPRPLDMPGRELVTLSDGFLNLEAMPERIVFIGGGIVSFELGHLAVWAGARVTILEMFERPLAPFEPDLVEALVKATRDLGVDVRTDMPVKAVREEGGGLVVEAGPDGSQRFEADLVVHGAGRVPAVQGLGLDAAGIEYSPRGIAVNAFMQSVSNPSVYAAGDCAATGFPLTPVADREGVAAAHNILHGNEIAIVHRGVPSAVFTYPPLAGVGLREAEARDRDPAVRVIMQDTSSWTEHKRIGMKHGAIKLLVDEANDRVVGAHILGERAEEMINVFALAIQHDLPFSRLKETLWAYPSFGYNLRYSWR